MTTARFRSRSDGTVTLRPTTATDAAVLRAGRDEEFSRWLGAESEMAPPLASVVVDGAVAGWIDFDVERSWLEPGEVNVGYFLIASFRRKGYATRALELLLTYLGEETDYRVATLLIDTNNERSLAVARRARFEQVAGIGGGAHYFKRAVLRPPDPE